MCERPLTANNALTLTAANNYPQLKPFVPFTFDRFLCDTTL